MQTPARARLTQLLSRIMEVIGAEAVSLRLVDGTTHELLLSSSTGSGEQALAEYLQTREFADDAVEIDIHDTLGRFGIETLLGVPLSAGAASLGTMWVGIGERRAFGEAERRRISHLSELLVAHLDNARLDATLRWKVEQLEGESELRERFISMLIHDLGMPLAAANVNAKLLVAADQPRATRVLGAAILHSVEQVERMVGDLVDAQRIRSGQRLPMMLADCNLTALVRDALEGMYAVYGDRFLLRGDRSVRGVWNADQLRRAIWNLCENAIKFGAEEAPVNIAVAARPEGAELTVHNIGTAISMEDQEKLFAPFSSSRSPIDGHPRGWGLGLTLVWGCAEAHGGRVTVASQPEIGTTFRLLIPFDARPYAMS